jgi:nucleoside-diphosphate-sugar epimerase
VLYQTNVIGTRSLITALQRTGTFKLIHLSSLAVIADGSVMTGADEAHPLPARNGGAYATTKALAEREALNSATDAFQVVVVRPPFVWGNGDSYSLPRLREYVKKGSVIGGL